MAGKASPRDDKQRAPKSEMNNSKLGIATASKTENETNAFGTVSFH